jgi:hypothetical protein
MLFEIQRELPLCGSCGNSNLHCQKHPEMTCDSITVETCSPPDAAGNWDSPQQFLVSMLQRQELDEIF